MNALLAALVVMACAAPALAQPPKKADGRPPMKQEERQRMREDMNVVNRGQKPERPRQMTPQQREQIRKDVREADQHLRR